MSEVGINIVSGLMLQLTQSLCVASVQNLLANTSACLPLSSALARHSSGLAVYVHCV